MNRSIRSLSVSFVAITSAALAQYPVESNTETPEQDPDELELEQFVQEVRASRTQAERSFRPCETREVLDIESQELEELINERRTRLAELCQRFTENHPDVLSLARQLDLLEARATDSQSIEPNSE